MDRLPIVYDIFNEILQGIKIKIDPDGSIWAKRMCSCPVFLKPLYITRPADLFDIDKRPVKVSEKSKLFLIHICFYFQITFGTFIGYSFLLRSTQPAVVRLNVICIC